MRAGSALEGYPALFNAPVSCAAKASLVLLNSAAASGRPSNATTVTSPTRTDATAPAGAASFSYGAPAFASTLFTMSQELVKRALPIGSNWKWQSFGSATTVIG